MRICYGLIRTWISGNERGYILPGGVKGKFIGNLDFEKLLKGENMEGGEAGE